MKTGKSVLAIMVQVFFISSILFFFSGAAMAECPGFTKVTGTANWFEGKTIGTNGMNSPALVDIDHDGDLDVFVGSNDGKIYYFKNTTTSPDSPSFTPMTGSENPLNLVSFPDFIIKPCFVDINGDKKPDLFFSVSLDRSLHYYKNTGNYDPEDPNLDPDMIVPKFDDYTGNDENPFKGKTIDTATPLSYNAFKPAFADIEGDDGDMDALFGMSDGSIKYYRNDGTKQLAAFPSEPTVEGNPFDEIPAPLNDATPDFTNENGLILGERGKIVYYRMQSPKYDSGCTIEEVFGKYYYPAFGNLFGNGEMKMLVGTVSNIGLEYWNYSNVIPVTPGDINGEDGLTLADAILGLKILAGADISGENVTLNAEVNNNDPPVIGMEEVIFVLREVAQAK
ncbi:MAG: FG-GAP repeat domain-containing protein [Desulfococcaceae bacterium]